MSDTEADVQTGKYLLPEAQLIIILDPPIERPGGGAVDQIVLREPTAAQVRAAETHLARGTNPLTLRESQLALITSVSKMARAVIDQMPISKQVEASEYLDGFTYPRRATGES